MSQGLSSQKLRRGAGFAAVEGVHFNFLLCALSVLPNFPYF